MKSHELHSQDFKVHQPLVNEPIFHSNALLKAFVFAFFMTFLFLIGAISTTEPTFLKNGYTTGSDDSTYLENINTALALNSPSALELREALVRGAEHAPAYPVALYLASKIAPFGIFLAVFLNFYAVYFIAHISIALLQTQARLASLWKFILITPGILFVACHAYKDIFLLLITLLAIKAFRDRHLTLALGLSFLSGYFRPFNWILIFLTQFFIARLWLTLLMMVCLSVAIFFIYPNVVAENVSPIISNAHDIAYRDLESYGSSYQPYGNLIFDYFIALIRFIFLPAPWSINWIGRPLFFSILEFVQSIIIWATFTCILFKPKVLVRVIRNQGAIFWYCIMQASIYSILYFGNAQPRHRLYIYLLCFYIFASILEPKTSKTQIRAMRP
jgi:hypothetical protein